MEMLLIKFYCQHQKLEKLINVHILDSDQRLGIFHVENKNSGKSDFIFNLCDRCASMALMSFFDDLFVNVGVVFR